MFKFMPSSKVHTVAAVVLLLSISSKTFAQTLPATETIAAPNNSSVPSSTIVEAARAVPESEPSVVGAVPVAPAPASVPEVVAAPVPAVDTTPVPVASSAPLAAPAPVSDVTESKVAPSAGASIEQAPATPPQPAEQSPPLVSTEVASASNVSSPAELAHLPVPTELTQPVSNVSEPILPDTGSQAAASNSSQQVPEPSLGSPPAANSEVSPISLPAPSPYVNVSNAPAQVTPAQQEAPVVKVAIPQVHAEYQQPGEPETVVPPTKDLLTAVRPHAEASTQARAADNAPSSLPEGKAALGMPTWALVMILTALIISSVFVTIVLGAFFVHKYKARTRSATIND